MKEQWKLEDSIRRRNPIKSQIKYRVVSQKRLFREQIGMEQAWPGGGWGRVYIRESKQKLLFESLVHVSVGVAGTSLKGVILRELPGPLRQSCGLISYCDCIIAQHDYNHKLGKPGTHSPPHSSSWCLIIYDLQWPIRWHISFNSMSLSYIDNSLMPYP